MDNWFVIVLIIAAIIIGIFIGKKLSNNTSMSQIPLAIIVLGIGNISSSFDINKLALRFTQDSIVASNDSETDYFGVLIGFILIGLGVFLWSYLKDRVFILNMLGLTAQKEIDDKQNISDLNLVEFKVKEILIDVSDIFSIDDMNEQRHNLIVKKIKIKCDQYINRSKEYKACFTGMAPIPYTILAGTFLNDNPKRYFEYKRSSNKYYELKKKRFYNDYPKLQVEYPSELNDKATDILVALSVTRRVQDADIVQFNEYDVIHIALESPKDNVIIWQEQLIDYAGKVCDVLENLKTMYKHLTQIHLVAAIPSCLSIEMGKRFALNNNRLPQIISYHFVNHETLKYPFGVLVTGAADKKNKFVRGCSNV